MKLLPALLLALLLAINAGCVIAPPFGSKPQPVQVVAVSPAPVAPGEADLKAIARAQTSVLEARALRPTWTVGDAFLTVAERELAAGDAATARELARRADEAARAVAQAHYLEFADHYYERAAWFARLKDAEAGTLREAEVARSRGDHRRVYTLLKPLVRHFYTADSFVTVQPGQDLPAVSAQRPVYDNPHLWPLLFRDNKGLIRNPERIKPGWRLRVRAHPRLEEIFSAIEYVERRELSANPAALDRAWIATPAGH